MKCIEAPITIKTWGKERLLKVTNGYAFKIIEVETNKEMSYHYHAVKEETWLINKGCGILTVNEVVSPVTCGDIIHIIPGAFHKILAQEAIEIIEVSTPELTDSIRVGGRNDYS